MARRTPYLARLDNLGPDPADKNVGGADRLLDAVMRLLSERGASIIANSLKPDDVAARAGKSRASYYRTEGFPGSDLAGGDEGRQAVLEAAVRRTMSRSAAATEQVAAAVDSFVEAGWRSTTPAEFILAASCDNFDTTSGPELIDQLFAAALSASSSEIASSLRAYYSVVTRAYAEQYTRLFDFLGYRVRPPFTMEQATLGLMALAEGLAVRALADEAVDRDLYGQLLGLFATSMVLAPGERIDPLDPRYQMLSNAGDPPRRSEIIDQFLRLFAFERESMPTLDELATAAGCAPAAITTAFGSMGGVALAAWAEWVPEFADAVERDRLALREADSLTLLYRCVCLVAVRAAEHPAVARALLMSSIGAADSTGALADPVVGLFERLIDDAGAAGELAVPGAARGNSPASRERMLAVALRTTVLHLVVGTPTLDGMSAADHGRWCADSAWALLMPARRGPSDPPDR